MQNKFKKIILFFGDIVILYSSLYLTLFLRYQQQPSRNSWGDHFWPFTVAFIVWIIIFYIADLYNLHIAVNNYRFFGLTIRSVGIAGLLTVASFYVNPAINIAPKTNMVIFVAVFLVLFLLWRRVFNWSLNTYLPKNNIAVIGYNDRVEELIKSLQDKPHLGYRIKLIISNLVSSRVNDIVITDDINNLKKLITEHRISSVVIVANPHQSPQLRAALFSCLPLKINFTSLSNFYETVTGKVPIEVINQMWFLENLSESNKKWFDILKRVYDIILAVAILSLTLAAWPIIAIIIKLESRGPVFIKMTRAGRNNQPFTMYKFRTMKEEDNNRTMTIANDPRITRFGSLLRKTRIDEIPQMINIINGEMSFIGPRPERPELIRELEREIPFYRERMLIKPGATGWDQVSGEYHSPSKEDTIKKLQYDLFYIKNRGLYLDLSIFLKTIATVLKRGGV